MSSHQVNQSLFGPEESELAQRHQALIDWVNSRREPLPVTEFFLLHQMGPNGQRRARYKKEARS